MNSLSLPPLLSSPSNGLCVWSGGPGEVFHKVAGDREAVPYGLVISFPDGPWVGGERTQSPPFRLPFIQLSPSLENLLSCRRFISEWIGEERLCGSWSRKRDLSSTEGRDI